MNINFLCEFSELKKKKRSDNWNAAWNLIIFARISNLNIIEQGIRPCQWGLEYAMARVLDCNLEISEFEIQLRSYVHFRTNTLVKGMNAIIHPHQLWDI